MNNILVMSFALLISFSSYGQGTKPNMQISFKDSVLLSNFWTDFSTAIKKNDKVKLATLCKFPFYCSPCADDSIFKSIDKVEISITKIFFYESQFNAFFNKPIKEKVEMHQNFEPSIFYPTFNDNNKQNGFLFSYKIDAPSNNREGSNGIIYLKNIKNKFKITGIYTNP